MTTTKPYAFRFANSPNTWMLVGGQKMWLNGWPMANQHGVFTTDVNIIDTGSPLLNIPILGPTPPTLP